MSFFCHPPVHLDVEIVTDRKPNYRDRSRLVHELLPKLFVTFIWASTALILEQSLRKRRLMSESAPIRLLGVKM